ncbi:MAG: GNAT family N-acetyltransferase [Coriobacteriia bacterium]|nr:GNAT family N-acetyltransferase [Coriobacteriia bacterium]
MTHLAPIVPPDPPLSDGVVALRTLSTGDIAPLHVNLADEAVREYMSIPLDQTIEGTARYVTTRVKAMADGADASFAVTDAVTGELLGTIGVERSFDDPAIGTIGYWLFAPARGRGVATRAVGLLTGWAFEALALARLQITVHERNLPSQRVAEKNGYSRECVMRSIAEQHGTRVDLVMFARLADDPAPEEVSR